MTVFRVRVPQWAFSNSPTARKRKEGIIHAVETINALWPRSFGRLSEINATTACGRELDMVYDSHFQTPRKCSICEGMMARGSAINPLTPIQIVPELPLVEQLRIEQETFPKSLKAEMAARDRKIKVAINEAHQGRML